MINNQWKDFLTKLSEAPDTQICKTQTAKLADLSKSDLISSTQIKKILDDCAYAALASDFAMVAMDSLWGMIKKAEQV